MTRWAWLRFKAQAGQGRFQWKLEVVKAYSALRLAGLVAKLADAARHTRALRRRNLERADRAIDACRETQRRQMSDSDIAR